MKSKYPIPAIVAALVAVFTSSCTCPSGKSRHSLSLAITAEREVCCAPAKARPAVAAPTAKAAAKTVNAKSCADPMSAACGGNCTPGDCRCVTHACKCAPKKVVVAAKKPAPKPAPKVAVVKPAPPPPAKVVAVAPPPPPQPTTEQVGWQRYKWEFANPPNGVRVAPNEALPPGIYPVPAQDGFWMKGGVVEQTIPARR